MSEQAGEYPWFGLVAARDSGKTHVRTFRGEHISEVVVASIAEHLWSTGEPEIRVKRSTLLKAAEYNIGIRQPPLDVQRAQRLMRLDTYLVAEFHAEYQRRGEPRRRTEIPLRLFGFGNEDYDAGTWTLRVTPHRGDEYWHLAPAGTTDVARQVEQLRRDLDDRRRVKRSPCHRLAPARLIAVRMQLARHANAEALRGASVHS